MILQNNILFLLGIGIFFGITAAWLFQRLRIPKVIGYIAIGIVIGQSGFNILNREPVNLLQYFNYFALGIIGFLVGGELKWNHLKKYIGQFSAILLAEGLGAFILVGSAITFITYMVSHNLAVSISAGVIFGAIASATDPASTIQVLWEYRAQGVLTTTIIAIVALDDVLAMTLYSIGSTIAQVLTGGHVSVWDAVMHIVIELGGAVLLGVGVGFIINVILCKSKERERTMVFTIAALLLIISISLAWGVDVILASMFLGVTLCNLSPRKSSNLFEMMGDLAQPVYVLFFVLVGARLHLASIPKWLWLVIASYVIMMSIGKIVGSFLGAKWTKADRNVQYYCGMGLLSQGGVAIGLSIMASNHLHAVQVTETMSLPDMIIFGITATTFIV